MKWFDSISKNIFTFHSLVILILLYSNHAPVSGYKSLFIPGVVNHFSCDHIHMVKEGETCLSIASKYHLSLKFFLWKNKRVNCRALEPMTELCVDKWL